MEFIFTIFKIFYYLLPVYFADMAPLWFRNTFKNLGKPLDFGTIFYGEPLFGKNKTLRGLLVGVIIGTSIFYFQKVLGISSLVDYANYSLILGFLLSFGAIFGDLIKSFIKRRIGIKSGERFIIADQIDAVLGAIIFSSIFMDYLWIEIFLMLFLTLLLKIFANHLAYYIGLRKQKW